MHHYLKTHFVLRCKVLASKWFLVSRSTIAFSLRDAFISPELITRNLHAQSFAFISFAFRVRKSFFGSLLVLFHAAHWILRDKKNALFGHCFGSTLPGDGKFVGWIKFRFGFTKHNAVGFELKSFLVNLAFYLLVCTLGSRLLAAPFSRWIIGFRSWRKISIWCRTSPQPRLDQQINWYNLDLLDDLEKK